MSRTLELTKTCVLSTIGTGTYYSTGHITGFISDVHVVISAAAQAAEGLNIWASSGTSETSQKILGILNPSTLGAYYYPREGGNGTTGAALSSSNIAVPISMYKEKFRVVVACSSDMGAATVRVKVRWY